LSARRAPGSRHRRRRRLGVEQDVGVAAGLSELAHARRISPFRKEVRLIGRRRSSPPTSANSRVGYDAGTVWRAASWTN